MSPSCARTNSRAIGRTEAGSPRIRTLYKPLENLWVVALEQSGAVVPVMAKDHPGEDFVAVKCHDPAHRGCGGWRSLPGSRAPPASAGGRPAPNRPGPSFDRGADRRRMPFVARRPPPVVRLDALSSVTRRNRRPRPSPECEVVDQAEREGGFRRAASPTGRDRVDGRRPMASISP